MSEEAIIGGHRSDYLNEVASEETLGSFPPEIVNAIQLGIDAESFLKNSKIGVYLYNRALSEITEATQDLSRMSSVRSREADEAHDRLRMGQRFLDWMNDALEHGRRAQEMAMEAEDEQARHEAEQRIEQA